MRTLIHDDEIRAVNVSYEKGAIVLELENGRTVHAPLEVLPVIRRNVKEQDLKKVSLVCGGAAVLFGNGEAVSVVSLLGLDDGYITCRGWRDKEDMGVFAGLH
ncbi:hypothetical protein D6779_00060 [Candidatus Parcubacteria bacterium]|nr:MAG: hypothetical protein D6779_00060 [Candidatus Parcubacteria bacterium]